MRVAVEDRLFAEHGAEPNGKRLVARSADGLAAARPITGHAQAA
jgi:hypothetical protein